MVKVARSRDASVRCWPISREQNDLARNIKIGRKVGDTLRIRGAMPVRVHMDDTGLGLPGREVEIEIGAF